MSSKRRQQPKRKTMIGTCDLCHDTEVIVRQDPIPEAFYQKFPEERDINSIGNCLKGQEYYHICFKCLKKTEKKVTDLEQENPSLFKEFEAGELSIEQPMLPPPKR
jgi:hypothetical protein